MGHKKNKTPKKTFFLRLIFLSIFYSFLSNDKSYMKKTYKIILRRTNYVK